MPGGILSDMKLSVLLESVEDETNPEWEKTLARFEQEASKLRPKMSALSNSSVRFECGANGALFTLLARPKDRADTKSEINVSMSLYDDGTVAVRGASSTGKFSKLKFPKSIEGEMEAAMDKAVAWFVANAKKIGAAASGA
jgi:hypothetical protein